MAVSSRLNGTPDPHGEEGRPVNTGFNLAGHPSSGGFNQPTTPDALLVVETIASSSSRRTNADSNSEVVSTYPTNKLMLVSQSPFFASLVERLPADSAWKVTLSVKEDQLPAAHALVHFIYRKELPAALEHIQLRHILALADQYGLEECLVCAVRRWSAVSPDKVDPKAVAAFWELSPTLLALPTVLPAVRAAVSWLRYACHDLESAWSQDSMRAALVRIPPNILRDLLLWDGLHVQHEDVVFLLLTEWLHHHYPVLEVGGEGMLAHIERLAPLPRLPHLSSTFLVYIVPTTPWFQLFWKAASFTAMALQYRLASEPIRQCLREETVGMVPPWWFLRRPVSSVDSATIQLSVTVPELAQLVATKNGAHSDWTYHNGFWWRAYIGYSAHCPGQVFCGVSAKLVMGLVGESMACTHRVLMGFWFSVHVPGKIPERLEAGAACLGCQYGIYDFFDSRPYQEWVGFAEGEDQKLNFVFLVKRDQ